MAVSVVCLTSVGTTESDPNVRVHDPIGPKLIRWMGDSHYRVGKIPFFHGPFRRMVRRTDPGAYGFVLARLHYMDDVVRREAVNGLEQLVILGAGLDTRGYRMGADLDGVRVFEVDLPTTSQEKRARLQRAIGSIPTNVTYVEVDFNREAFLEPLAKAGLDGSDRTLFVLSGVSMYLPERAVVDLLAHVSSYRGSGSSIIFDHFFAGLTEAPEAYHGGAQFVAKASKAGEEPMYGIEMDDVAGVLASKDLELISHRDMADLAEEYLRREDGSLVERPYDFAAIAHARVAE